MHDRVACDAEEKNVTKLDKPLRREIEIDSRPYTLTLSPYKLKLTPKGHRNGIELSWPALLRMRRHEDESRLPAAPLN
jgi:hypothetical protein